MPRTRRQAPIQPNAMRMNVITKTLDHCSGTPGMVSPRSRAENANSSGSRGIVIRKSTTRWIMLSTQCPKYPEMPPMMAPKSSLNRVTTNDTLSDTRAA